MKNDTIRRAYNTTNPTSAQKEKMLAQMLAQSPQQPERKEYTARAPKRKRLSWLPMAAGLALFLAVAGILVHFWNRGDSQVIYSDPAATEGYFASDLRKASEEWAAYLSGRPDITEAEFAQAMPKSYMDYGCYDSTMMDKLDAVCEKYGITLKGNETYLNSYATLIGAMGISDIWVWDDTIYHTDVGSSYYSDGCFELLGSVTMGWEGTPWIYPVAYEYYRIPKTVFHEAVLELGNLEHYEHWNYTTENGVPLTIGIGDPLEKDNAFLLAEREEDILLVLTQEHRVGDAVLGEQTMDKEAMEAFAETLNFDIGTPRIVTGIRGSILADTDVYSVPHISGNVLSTVTEGTEIEIKKLELVNGSRWALITEGWIPLDNVRLSFEHEETFEEDSNIKVELDVENADQLNSGYANTLRLYSQAYEQSWDAALCAQHGMSTLTPVEGEGDTLSYAISDLDGNGVDELVICQGPFQEFCDIYVMDNGLVRNVMSVDGTALRNLCEGGVVKYVGAERGEYNDFVSFWRLNDVQFEIEMTVYRLDNQWYAGMTESLSSPVTPEEAQRIVDSYPAVKLDLIPIAAEAAYPSDTEVYASVLSTYEEAIAENWNPGECSEMGISLMVGYYGELYNDLGYSIMDLDGDGIQELIITDGNYIYDLYTIVDDEEYGPLRLLTGSERITYNLMEGNVIFHWGSGGAAVNYYTFSKLNGRELILQEGYMFDADTDPDSPWFFYDGENRGAPCGDFDAEAVVNGGYTSLEIPFTPFA